MKTILNNFILSFPHRIGKEFISRAFVDADFAGDNITRRSRTGFLVMINNEPLYWFSKKQSSMETNSFGSEFVAMRQCCEYLRGLWYKLRMMGIPVNNQCFIFGANKSVLWNTTIPDSILKKEKQVFLITLCLKGLVWMNREPPILRLMTIQQTSWPRIFQLERIDIGKRGCVYLIFIQELMNLTRQTIECCISMIVLRGLLIVLIYIYCIIILNFLRYWIFEYYMIHKRDIKINFVNGSATVQYRRIYRQLLVSAIGSK